MLDFEGFLVGTIGSVERERVNHWKSFDCNIYIFYKMSYEPPFDDDELINDYNQEDIPEEYEDEYFDELMEENDPTEMEKDEHQNKMTDLNSDGENVEESAQVEKTDAFTSTVILSKSEIVERDLYSFERLVLVFFLQVLT